MGQLREVIRVGLSWTAAVLLGAGLPTVTEMHLEPQPPKS